ncbi:MAG: Gfo/Idh/MocA family protein [Rhodospirillales bacterium]
MTRIGVGIIGCGTISRAYVGAMKRFDGIELRAVADIRSGAAAALGAEAGVPALRVDQLLRRDDVEIVVNLTVPLAHTDVSLAVLRAGKHVHSEKPLGVDVADARKVMDLADERGLRVGCAPDTFLGGGHQTVRKLIDDGAIGTPVAGTAFFLCPGHERWHPAPGFYYLRGGGPMLDMGPYYLTDLVQLLGPVASVVGSSARPRAERVVASEPMRGTRIPVEVPTHVTGTLEFASGALVSVAMSFDVPKHRHTPIEIYGTEGSIVVPDPNRFGGEVLLARTGGDFATVPTTHANTDGEFRSIGVADLAAAIIGGRPHRASGALALHVLEAMEAIQQSADEGRRVTLTTTVDRPAMMPAGSVDGVFD